MYCIHLDGEVQGNPAICIEGRLEDATNIELELNKILRHLRDSPEFNVALGIYIDLGKVESICDECFRAFQRIQNRYPIRFRGYSLFLEMQLIDHQLLPGAYSKANKK